MFTNFYQARMDSWKTAAKIYMLDFYFQRVIRALCVSLLCILCQTLDSCFPAVRARFSANWFISFICKVNKPCEKFSSNL